MGRSKSKKKKKQTEQKRTESRTSSNIESKYCGNNSLPCCNLKTTATRIVSAFLQDAPV